MTPLWNVMPGSQKTGERTEPNYLGAVLLPFRAIRPLGRKFDSPAPLATIVPPTKAVGNFPRHSIWERIPKPLER